MDHNLFVFFLNLSLCVWHFYIYVLSNSGISYFFFVYKRQTVFQTFILETGFGKSKGKINEEHLLDAWHVESNHSFLTSLQLAVNQTTPR